METDFPSRCAVKATAKGDFLIIRQNRKTAWNFRYCVDSVLLASPNDTELSRVVFEALWCTDRNEEIKRFV